MPLISTSEERTFRVFPPEDGLEDGAEPDGLGEEGEEDSFTGEGIDGFDKLSSEPVSDGFCGSLPSWPMTFLNTVEI